MPKIKLSDKFVSNPAKSYRMQSDLIEENEGKILVISSFILGKRILPFFQKIFYFLISNNKKFYIFTMIG
jgi:hypothetical protein